MSTKERLDVFGNKLHLAARANGNVFTGGRQLQGRGRRTMTVPNDKHKIRQHYDAVSPYYRTLWGEHLHHGYWIRGDETKEKAQIQLIEHLLKFSEIKPDSEILDVGCGFGGSTIYLAKHCRAQATGITISSVQIEMANTAANNAQADVKFLLMDAEAMSFANLFDVVWSVESISHYQNTASFFASAARLMKPGGTLAIIDWFKKKNLGPSEHKKYIRPIEKGMMVELRTMDEYEAQMRSNGLLITRSEILNGHVAKTWDLGLDIVKNKSLWKLAAQTGIGFVDFLDAFRAMRSGFASGNFIHGLLLAKKA